MSNNLVSVIMPAFNCEKYINEAIDSILSQTHTKIEVLIADDCSTDQTKAIIDGYDDPRIKVFHNDENLGYLRTCNKLFTKCNGEFITFQDADDRTNPERLQLQLSAFDQNGALGICGTCGELIDENGAYIDHVTRPITHDQIATGITKHNQFIGSSIMIPKKVYNDVGGYRLFFDRIGNEDYDWAVRIVEKFESMNLAERLYSYRQHIASISKKTNLRKHISKDIVTFLAQQRREHNGEDGLSLSELRESLDHHIIALEKPYLEDKSKIHREQAAGFMYNKMYSEAIRESMRAVRMGPLSVVNYRTLLYCLRKSI